MNALEGVTHHSTSRYRTAVLTEVNFSLALSQAVEKLAIALLERVLVENHTELKLPKLTCRRVLTCHSDW